MRLTTALYVRQWWAKLHPPLPQTPRESQQLLQILEGSFRKHLDETYPSPAQRQTSDTRYSIPLVSPDSSSIATHHYFNTLLNNPLLAKPSDESNVRAPLTINAVTVFANASNDGKITMSLVRRCATDYLQGIRNGEKVAEKDRLAQKLASWTYTTNSSMREAFLASTEVLDLAVQVAGVDKQEAVAWDWLRMVYERSFTPEGVARKDSLMDRKWLILEDMLVSYLMRLSIRRGDLGDAAQQFVEASQYRSTSMPGTVQPKEHSEGLSHLPLEHSWKRLVAAIVHFRTRHGISEALYGRLMVFGMSWNSVPQFSKPVASVYHPSSPSASDLSQNLRNPEAASHFLSKQAGASKKFRRAMLVMILDAAQLSLNQKLRDQAQFLLEFARTHYTDFLPTSPSKSTTSLNTQIQNAQGELHTHTHNIAWT